MEFFLKTLIIYHALIETSIYLFTGSHTSSTVTSYQTRNVRRDDIAPDCPVVVRELRSSCPDDKGLANARYAKCGYLFYTQSSLQESGSARCAPVPDITCAFRQQRLEVTVYRIYQVPTKYMEG